MTELNLTTRNDFLLVDDLTTATTINTLRGNDFLRITGSVGRTINLDAGNDMILAESVTAALNVNAGTGNDFVILGAGNDTVLGGSGRDTLLGGVGDDFLRGDAGDDYLFGAVGKDSLLGDDGDDFLYGEINDDLLVGGAGDDLLVGGVGDDTLIGGVDDNILNGGAGNDLFFLQPNANQQIQDFTSGSDQISLSLFPNPEQLFILAGGGYGGPEEPIFNSDLLVIGSALTNINQRFLYTAAGDLFFDSDGTGRSRSVLVAQFGPNVTLSASDFVNTASPI
jgi:Ca2+-binding RTX toxin-like protein